MQGIKSVLINVTKNNLNPKVNQNYKVTLNGKSQGQGHKERLQLKRTDQGL